MYNFRCRDSLGWQLTGAGQSAGSGKLQDVNFLVAFIKVALQQAMLDEVNTFRADLLGIL